MLRLSHVLDLSKMQKSQITNLHNHPKYSPTNETGQSFNFCQALALYNLLNSLFFVYPQTLTVIKARGLMSL